MTDTMKSKKLPAWAGGVIVLLVAAIVALIGLLATSIAERRWEAQQPILVSQNIGQFESDNAVWGADYPREYDAYKKMGLDDTRTMYGGAVKRDYLEEDPRQVILFAKYGFSKHFFQARGHTLALDDIRETKRIKRPFNAGTCWTCKSPDVPRMMGKFGKEIDKATRKEGEKEETDPIKLIGLGAAKFYASNWHDLDKDMKHPIGCLDCHDPKTMKLRITRPALREGFAAMGRDIDKATHQEMRSLVCAQCHVEYYFKTDEAAGKKNYLTFPWSKGTSVEGMIEYYDTAGFKDFIHPISKVEVIKSQHPDWEMYSTGVHAYRKVSCSDCHMPYRSEGGMKFTDHHVQSPLLNIENSCAVCHRWSETELKTRVETIQTKVANARIKAEDALVAAHFDVAAAMEAKVADAELAPVRKMIRHAQFRWDYVAANNSMGFHSPQESMRILGDAVNNAQTARIHLARLIAAKGVIEAPKYPDISDRKKAMDTVKSFLAGTPPKLLP
ncbi:MAG: ammonia-forming cytochrome c nitrite reductase subunit c552 [Phycisphaerae bacterium]|nr:ammonia-forming cytochrome c nitrite reductase subunit c552 [Phycisphaerae bacterium]